jgi:hypothetical protein
MTRQIVHDVLLETVELDFQPNVRQSSSVNVRGVPVVAYDYLFVGENAFGEIRSLYSEELDFFGGMNRLGRIDPDEPQGGFNAVYAHQKGIAIDNIDHFRVCVILNPVPEIEELGGVSQVLRTPGSFDPHGNECQRQYHRGEYRLKS